MQVLYSMNRNEQITLDSAKKLYHQYIDKTYDLYLFSLLNIYKLAGLSLKELDHRQSKHIKSDEDENFKPKLWENELIQTLHNDLALQKEWKQRGHFGKIDLDYLKNIYKDFAKSDAYVDYMSNPDASVADHKEIFKALFKRCIKDEGYADNMEAFNSHWFVDESLVVGTMKRTFKMLPNVPEKFFEEFLPEDEPVYDFGIELLQRVIREDEPLLEIIQPSLQNWDITRVAILDLILLKMAVSELMNFPTIPTKVTLNEYVDISKQYSTEKSKDFINGILDRLMKKLDKDGKIKKEGRGLIG